MLCYYQAILFPPHLLDQKRLWAAEENQLGREQHIFPFISLPSQEFIHKNVKCCLRAQGQAKSIEFHPNPVSNVVLMKKLTSAVEEYSWYVCFCIPNFLYIIDFAYIILDIYIWRWKISLGWRSQDRFLSSGCPKIFRWCNVTGNNFLVMQYRNINWIGEAGHFQSNCLLCLETWWEFKSRDESVTFHRNFMFWFLSQNIMPTPNRAKIIPLLQIKVRYWQCEGTIKGRL